MDVRDYEYIVAIADQGSITRAAEQLFITQPALTKFLQRIEKELGLSLFVRKGKQFILTEAGQKYVEVGHEILRLDRKLTEQLKQDGITQKKRIRLGFSMGRLYELMESVLPQFHSVYPDIQIIAMETSSRKQFEALQRKELDIAIVTNVEQRVGYTYLPVEKGAPKHILICQDVFLHTFSSNRFLLLSAEAETEAFVDLRGAPIPFRRSIFAGNRALTLLGLFRYFSTYCSYMLNYCCPFG